MSRICYIKKEDLNAYDNISNVENLNKEDVATLLETFEAFLEEGFTYKDISTIVVDTDGLFYVVVDKGCLEFDLYEFINNYYDGDTKVSCINARFEFPRELSRGIFEYNEEEYDEDEEEEDTPTSYLDVNELNLPKVYKLYYRKHGISIEISKSNSIVIGRSVKKADFLIRDNGNIGREHCKVYLDEFGKLRVHDYDSLNGTFVNGARVHSSNDVVLNVGDSLVLADEEFEIL